MSTDETRLTELAAAVLDGTPVDWSAVESGADAIRLPFLEHLKAVAAIAELHRTTTTEWGHLRLLERIGGGSFGEVYRAWDTRLDREVALKLLPEDTPSGGQAGRTIIHEGQLLARVRHPNVVTIYGAERIGGRVGLWMEFVRGKTLEQLIEQGKVFGATETIEIGVELCRAVAAVHAAGLLHRDIKATNVMLADDGRVVLMDFGAGRALAERAEKDLAGTPLYMAPEVLNGNEATVQSDIFGIGVLLYHLLTRSYPVSARSVSELRLAHERGERRPLRAARPDVPSKLATVIDRAIDARPDRRYESADALATGLLAVRSPGTARRWVVGLTVASLVVTAIGFAVSGTRRAPGRLSGAPTLSGTQALTQNGHTVSAGISPDGRLVVYVVDQAGRSSLWLSELATNSNRQIAPPAEVLYWQPTFSRDGQFLYFVRSRRDNPKLALYRMPIAGTSPAQLIHEHPDLMGGLALSPDGRHVAVIQSSQPRDESLVVVVDTNGEGARTIARRKYSAAYWQVAWSPDGRHIAAVAGNADATGRHMNVVSLNADDGTEKPVTTQPMAFVGALGWLANGTGLLMVASDTLPRTDQIWYLSHTDGTIQKLTDDANSFYGVSLTADSTALVTRQLRLRRIIWVAPAGNADTSRTSGDVPIDAVHARQITNGYWRLEWTPDGDLLYSSTTNGAMHLWRAGADGSHPRQLTTEGLNTDPTISPDGRVIVFVSVRGEVQHLWRMDADGRNARQLTNGRGETRPRVTPDGLSILYNSTTDFTVWRIPLEGGEPARLTDTYAREPVPSPNGAFIAYNFRDKQAAQQWKIAVIPANGGPRQRVFDRRRADYQTFELNWSPDGRAITYEASEEGVSNIWSQPVAGGPPRRLTNFTTDYIYAFSWTADAKQLAVVRGAWDGDLIRFLLRP